MRNIRFIKFGKNSGESPAIRAADSKQRCMRGHPCMPHLSRDCMYRESRSNLCLWGAFAAR